MTRKCFPRLWVFSGYLSIVSDQKSCETLKTVICGAPTHVFETIRLKHWRKSKAFNHSHKNSYDYYLTKNRSAKAFSRKSHKFYKKISVMMIFFNNIASHLVCNCYIQDSVKGIPVNLWNSSEHLVRRDNKGNINKLLCIYN